MDKTIAIQGLPGSYTSMALRAMYPELSSEQIIYHTRFKDVFDDVKSGRVGRGIVAFYNTRLDAIHEPYMQLTGHDTMRDLWVDGGVTLPVNHCLAMIEDGSLETIKTVHTQEEARQQCDNFMYELNGKATFVPESDTALSAQMVAESSDKTKGAICSEQAAALYGLTIIRHAIQDDKVNQTRFASFVQSDKGKTPLDADNSLLALTLSEKPGSLLKALEVFADYEIDLRTIKSRNIPDTPMEVDIITEIRAGIHDSRMPLVIEELAKNSVSVHFIGSYKETNPENRKIPAIPQEKKLIPQNEIEQFLKLQQRVKP